MGSVRLQTTEHHFLVHRHNLLHKIMKIFFLFLCLGTVTLAVKVNNKAASRDLGCNCQCSNTVFKDKYGKVNGNCKSTDKGGQWCYVDPRYAQCNDLVKSKRFNQFWSYQACATPERSSYQCRSSGYGSGGFGSGSGGFNSGHGSSGFNSGHGSSSGYGSSGFNSGHGSSGFNSGHGSGGFTSGHGSSGFNSGHGSSGFNSGHSSSGFNSGHGSSGGSSFGSGGYGSGSSSGSQGFGSGSSGFSGGGSGNSGYSSGGLNLADILGARNKNKS